MQNISGSDFFNPVITQTWTNGRHQVRCLKVIQETADVKTFCFGMQQPVLFFFKPGQFVTLELEIENEPEMRSYTISSSPSIPYSFSITVKRVPGGKVSNWLHENLAVGDALVVHGPMGQFNSADFPASKVLLLSGGVGITPVMSMARWFFNTNSDVDMAFVHSARTPEDIIYRAELDYMSTRIENFKLHIICERTPTGQAWSGYRGYLNREMLQLIAPDFAEREIFCCGPAVYMRAVREFLQHADYDMSRYHEESFGGDTLIPSPTVQQPVIGETGPDKESVNPLCTVKFMSSGRQIEVAEGTTLNEAAASASLKIPKACGMGICGTCKVKVLDGQTEMSHNGGIDDEEIEQGYVLSCCTIIKGNVEIDY